MVAGIAAHEDESVRGSARQCADMPHSVLLFTLAPHACDEESKRRDHELHFNLPLEHPECKNSHHRTNRGHQNCQILMRSCL